MSSAQVIEFGCGSGDRYDGVGGHELDGDFSSKARPAPTTKAVF
ncbi:MAG: hypothetical protein ACI9OJ_005051 [Myxococcota bacterium]|jgi:hypothetical protein